MILSEVILNCEKYIDTEKLINMILAKKHDNQFNPTCEALMIELTLEEMEMKMAEIAETKCLGYDYFLELFIIMEFFEGLKQSNEYKSDIEKVNGVIHFAEFDA